MAIKLSTDAGGYNITTFIAWTIFLVTWGVTSYPSLVHSQFFVPRRGKPGDEAKLLRVSLVPSRTPLALCAWRAGHGWGEQGRRQNERGAWGC